MALDSAAVGSYAHLLAAPAVTNAAPPDAPVTVGENSGGSPGANITVAGTGADTPDRLCKRFSCALIAVVLVFCGIFGVKMTSSTAAP